MLGASDLHLQLRGSHRGALSTSCRCRETVATPQGACGRAAILRGAMAVQQTRSSSWTLAGRRWRAEEGLERNFHPQGAHLSIRVTGQGGISGSPLPRPPPCCCCPPPDHSLPLELSSSGFGNHLLLFLPLWDFSQTVRWPGSCPWPCLPGEGRPGCLALLC